MYFTDADNHTLRHVQFLFLIYFIKLGYAVKHFYPVLSMIPKGFVRLMVR
jgi:hypothetical protein